MTGEVPESDEVAGHQYRLAQMRRLVRFADRYQVNALSAASRLPALFAEECLDDGQLVPDLEVGDAEFEARLATLFQEISRL